jgi:pyrimidine-nucleoside phosphorylase
MRAVDLIRRKRDGKELSPEEIDFLISGYMRGEIPDYQMAAWLMAVVWRGLSRTELAALVEVMRRSPRPLRLRHLPGPRVDKHSTGGVGDKTSLVVAPLAAAAGAYVPMVSGRALGHTGGTLDKLESIPGFNTRLTLDQFCRVLENVGCALIGQTEEIAPADRLLYALRDATATVESPYLICASIMSKKLSEDLDGLVLDVKTGSGAFLKSEKEALFLAELLVETGRSAGVRTVALLTDMDQPLGQAVGNALEVAEALDVLRGGGPPDLRELCLELTGWMLTVAGLAGDIGAGRQQAERLLKSQAGLEKFRQIVGCQGGDVRVVDDPRRLPRARHQLEVPSPRGGVVAAMDCEKIGLAATILGAGRARKEDAVDPGVGLVVHCKRGDAVAAGQPLVTLHYNAEDHLEEARRLVLESYSFADVAPGRPQPLVYRILGA